jgi:Protein of unknown function (DUF2974)
MPYTDKELRDATDIAYVDLQKIIESLPSGGGPYTIEELYNLAQADGIDVDFSALTADPATWEIIKNWKIVDYYDTNDETGFYGVAIDPGDGNLIVSFRGSENITELDNAVNDWVNADLGLMNSPLTIQQAEVEKFLQQIANSDYIHEYDNISFTGHSLGGNLASHGGIVSSLFGLDGKVQQIVSFDGPGFSDEYIDAHRHLIDMMSPKMTHYQWSIVGSLLNVPPGAEFKSLQVKENDSFVYHLGGKHSASNLLFDENGNVIVSKEDWWSKFIGRFSRGVDHHVNNQFANLIVGVTGNLIIAAVWLGDQMFDENGLTDFGFAVIFSTIRIVSLIGFVPVLKFALIVVGIVVAFVLITVAIEIIHEVVDWLVDQIVNLVAAAFEFAKDLANQLKDLAVSIINGLKAWYKENFDAGYRYASANPVITVDTYKLRNYAQRLASINARLKSLDHRMDSLYWNVGLLDVLTLMRADLMTGKSRKISQIIHYLEETANLFEKAERNIKSNV